MSESIIWDGVYEAEPDFYPHLVKYDRLRVIARVNDFNSKPRPERLEVEVGLFDDPRVSNGVPSCDLQERIKTLLWNAFGNVKVTFTQERIKN